MMEPLQFILYIEAILVVPILGTVAWLVAWRVTGEKRTAKLEQQLEFILTQRVEDKTECNERLIKLEMDSDQSRDKLWTAINSLTQQVSETRGDVRVLLERTDK